MNVHENQIETFAASAVQASLAAVSGCYLMSHMGQQGLCDRAIDRLVVDHENAVGACHDRILGVDFRLADRAAF
ncbi:hypothetical protein [Maricaulis sp.]|uniref:hypothetical protein n=1 Tax=Maricaulis sp. TaxID=1486257 RepID=UPI0025B80C65|nr:hypothetical protein [Maricaulis sp.]